MLNILSILRTADKENTIKKLGHTISRITRIDANRRSCRKVETRTRDFEGIRAIKIKHGFLKRTL